MAKAQVIPTEPSPRDNIRSMLLGHSTPRRRKVVKITVAGKDVEVEVRQMNLAEFEKCAKDCDKKGGLESDAILISRSVVVPGTEELVFTSADIQAMLQETTTSWVIKMRDECKMVNVEEPKEVGKTSGETGSESGSSASQSSTAGQPG
jgi:hypothetical protein